MSNDKTLPTSLEHLPVEIFLQIFGFLPLREIVTAFSGLNYYINSVIRSVIGISYTVNYNDDTSMYLLRMFATQISRLVITHTETVNFTSLINLRSLILKYGTHAQFDSIRPQHFPMLEILHIYAVAGISPRVDIQIQAIKDLFQIILSNGFPRLRICTAVGIGSLTSSETWTGSPALYTLHLNMATAHDYQQLLSACPNLRRFTSFGPWWVDPFKDIFYSGSSRRVFNELRKLERLELENKFILDVNPMSIFGRNKPPPRFNNTEMAQRSYTKDVTVIQGRILPKNEPYCRASFLIEITLSPEYPFKMPDVIFLDPIYHPNVTEDGRHCRHCCWGFSAYGSYKPTTSLTELIEAVIHVIDNYSDTKHISNDVCCQEYKSNYQGFYEKALRLTLSYGRPRY